MTVITRAEAEARFQAAVTKAREVRDQAIERAWDSYREILDKAERERQETVAHAYKDYEAAETRAIDQCTETMNQANKVYREMVPAEPPGDDNKGGQS